MFPSKTYVGRILLGISLAANFGFVAFVSLRRPVAPPTPASQLQLDDRKTAADIEAYLDQIAPAYATRVQQLAQEKRLVSWGCGPSSFALAQVIDKKFFEGKAPIVAAYDNKPYEIVVRFGFANPAVDAADPGSIVDHVWLEVYLGDTFLYVDPTIGQFGRMTGIAHHEYKVGDPQTSTNLLLTYGIRDIRLRVLMQKVADRIPVEQPPYPGVTIPQSAVPTYMEILQDRDLVDAGKTPPAWADWVAALEAEFH